MRKLAMGLVLSLCAVSVFAVDLGRVDGTLTIDQNKVPLTYAYAIGRQRNETTNKNDTRVVLTDKALAPDANLAELDATFPTDMYGVLLNIASNGKVTRVVLLHPKGTYDGGFLEDVPEFHFKTANAPRGTIAGRVNSDKVQTSTMVFTIDADFNAQVK